MKKYENEVCLVRPSPCRCVVFLSLLENWLEVSLSVEFYVGCPSHFFSFQKVPMGMLFIHRNFGSGRLSMKKVILKINWAT